MYLPSFLDKIVDLQHAEKISNGWKSDGLRVVFTNGCFDLLHLGHVSYLDHARSIGDRLIVGVNTDQSVQELKGEHRPIKDEQSRVAILAALSSVDLVILFGEQTPIHLIKTLMPDILCKGGDYAIAEIVGATEVKSAGGDVVVIPFVEGHSTTSFINKINHTSHD